MGYRDEDGIHDRCLDSLKLGEPFLVLRAHDKVAVEAVRLWCVLAGLVNSPKAKIDEARRIAGAMERWGKEHGTKVPD